MSGDDMLGELHAALLAHLPSVILTESGLEAGLDARYARLVVVFDHDPDNASMRVYTMMPPPSGAGTAFFNWCLSMNTLYWDVKIGLDAQGMLLVMADIDLTHLDVPAIARVLIVRVAAMCELIDDDLVAFLLDNGLATPAQVARWSATDDGPV